MNYHVIAYRWGYIQEQSCLFSSANLQGCINVAEAYPNYRGGKYGCAVYQSPSLKDGRNGDGASDPLYYFPSLHGEKKPAYNHRCDVFNRVVCAIRRHEKFKDCEWLVQIITEAETAADRRNQLE